MLVLLLIIGSIAFVYCVWRLFLAFLILIFEIIKGVFLLSYSAARPETSSSGAIGIATVVTGLFVLTILALIH